jgi:hypothetical protein
MTPAEELRAAAAKLRETRKDLVNFVDIRGRFPIESWAEGFGPDDRVNLPQVNAWIRLASPALAEPLATAMVAIADAVELNPDLIHRVGYGEVLAVARAITGGTP